MAKTRRGKDEPTVIKKYANRRLYDTGRSSYVTLEDLREMMREGYDFVVQDAKTGEDITRSVLTQIVAEKESSEGGENLLPTNFLRQLVTLYGNNVPGALPKYLESAMEMFMKNNERVREQINKSMSNMGAGMGGMKGMFQPPNMPQMPGMAGMEELNRKNMEMIQNTMKMFTPFGMKAPGAHSSRPATAANKEDKIRELRQNIAEMQKEIERIAAE